MGEAKTILSIYCAGVFFPPLRCQAVGVENSPENVSVMLRWWEAKGILGGKIQDSHFIVSCLSENWRRLDSEVI